jgi:hypothetical protein
LEAESELRAPARSSELRGMTDESLILSYCSTAHCCGICGYMPSAQRGCNVQCAINAPLSVPKVVAPQATLLSLPQIAMLLAIYSICISQWKVPNTHPKSECKYVYKNVTYV